MVMNEEEILEHEIEKQLSKVMQDFIEVYPTIFDEDCWDGQNIFETALQQCGFFGLDEDDFGTVVLEDFYFKLYELTTDLKKEVAWND
ncbi:MAG: hypothetical protein HOM71_02610 [Deltaproteobacteria bacterium]|jgi:hypothetical protein|nr:hypothetical protein [Deltaproteobacteria bacterium]